jgi:hypothetical protein
VESTHKRGTELEDAEEETSVLGGASLLNVELREGHEVTVGQTDEKTADIEGGNVGCGHHDDVGNCTEQTCDPEAHFSTKLGSDEASKTGADESTKGHQG